MSDDAKAEETLLEPGDYEEVTTKLQGTALLHQNALFTLRRKNKKCDKYTCRKDTCPATLVVEEKEGEEKKIYRQGEHNHPVDGEGLVRTRITSALRMQMRGKATTVATREYKELKDKVKRGLVAGVSDMPEFASLKNIIDRLRRRDHPPVSEQLPRSVADFPKQFAVTMSEARFLLDVITPNEEETNVVLAADEDLQSLSRCEIVILDGGFQKLPSCVGQLWVIHGLLPDDHVIRPLVYALMTGRSAESYEGVLASVKKHVEERLHLAWAPRHVAQTGVDEDAPRRAFVALFPEVTTSACFFEHRQRIAEWLRRWRLIGSFRKKSEVRAHVEKMAALCHQPPEDVPAAYAAALETSPTSLDRRLPDFNGYMGQRVGVVESWNIHGAPEMRVSNRARDEWHALMSSHLEQRKPQLWTLVDLLKTRQSAPLGTQREEENLSDEYGVADYLMLKC